MFTEGVWRHGWKLAAAGIGVLVAGIGGLFAAVLFHVLRRVEERAQLHLDKFDERRRLLDEDMRQREHAVSVREAAVHRMMTINGIRYSSTARALDQALNDKSALQARVAAVTKELEEVLDEHNQMVRHDMQTAIDRFTPRGYGEIQKTPWGLRFRDIASDQSAPDDVIPLRRNQDL